MAISGDWQGCALQEKSTHLDGQTLTIDMNLSATRKAIKGSLTFHWDSANPANIQAVKLNLSGGFIQDSYVMLDYRGTKINVIRYGIILLEFMPTSREMVGRFLGFGPESRSIIHGTFQVKKD